MKGLVSGLYLQCAPRGIFVSLIRCELGVGMASGKWCGRGRGRLSGLGGGGGSESRGGSGI